MDSISGMEKALPQAHCIGTVIEKFAGPPKPLPPSNDWY